ncbi:MAG TPA: phage major capsid protein [Planctomycetes bacterium]|nr:phage major capsid protein [Planctomycetota bacterium]
MSELTIEQKLKQTADTIETAVEDIRKNKATKQEVLDLIEEKRTEDQQLVKGTKADVETLNTGIAEAQKDIKELQNRIRNFSKSQMSAQPAHGYSGRFSSVREAKTFALLVMAASLNGHARFQKQYDHVRKQLEELGVEPYWTDQNGRKAMEGSSMTGGGALVSAEQSATMIKLLELYGRYRANAMVMPMGAGETLVPKIDGLLTVYCPGQGGTVTEADPEIQTIALTPKTLCALTAYSMELEDDSLVALAELLADLFARSFAYYEDLCGFKGDGTSTYFGFKGITAALLAVDSTISNIQSLVVGAGNAYSELTLANFESVVGTLPEFADNGDAKWYVHRYFFWTVMVKLALAAGSGTATEILTGQATRQRSYLSYPVEFSQVMPKAEANSQICALLANLRQGAILGTRGGIEFAQSSERYFEKGLIAVRGRDRVAINAHGVGDTTDAGPICGLITAAS